MGKLHTGNTKTVLQPEMEGSLRSMKAFDVRIRTAPFTSERAWWLLLAEFRLKNTIRHLARLLAMAPYRNNVIGNHGWQDRIVNYIKESQTLH